MPIAVPMVTEAKRKRLPVVGIGASAGGVEAFRGFFETMPPDSDMAFVVILHLPADQKSLLPEILGRWTTMPVVEVTDGCMIEVNRVYVPPPGIVVTLRDGRLYPRRQIIDEPRELTPIDAFFNSLGTALGEDAVGIVLSGTGSDGTLGLKVIKSCGGLTMAQGINGSFPQHDGMPASAIAAGVVDIVAPVEAMPAHIIGMQPTRRAISPPGELTGAQAETSRLAICASLRRQIGHDFSGYKEKTFLRRVQRRVQMLGLTSLDEYLAHLDGDRGESVLLFQDLLIGVTSFFRDAETFETLERLVIPRLFEGKGLEGVVRVWVPGCATGEEAYSLAILLREQADRIGQDAPRVQVFATDIDEPAIAAARAGRYPAILLQALSPERLRRFFVEGVEGSYTVGKSVRELCTFSAHSLTRDPPFSRIDLVSCRNLLIYLDNDLQAVVIPAFHYSLVPDGILLLGSSESVSRHENLFAIFDRNHRIFQRRDTPSPPLQLTGRGSVGEASAARAGSSRVDAARMGALRMKTRASSRILERFAPAFVVVGADGEIVQYSSRIGRFLEPAPGVPSQNVLVMARRGLRAHLRSVLSQAVESGRPVETGVLAAVVGEAVQRITLAVEPLTDPGANTLYLIVFVESAGEPAKTAEGEPASGDRTGGDRGHDLLDHSADHQLEADLRDTREQLQSITEEHETAVEELRSANEELHSVNEELQSTNEELETSKEEIQSINEELQTVNSQLAGKVDELDHKNSDLQNLFDSTQVATIFLDPYLVVRGFTPAVATIYNLIPSDQGRPLTDIMSRLRYTGLRDDVRRVLASLKPLERRVVRDDDSAHYLMRILPYRSPDSTIDGTVVTFVDVTSIVQAEQHQRLLVDELNHRVKNMLTVVISLANQTMRRSRTMEEFSKNYMGRVHALTSAYSLLSSENWQTVALRDIVIEELKPFVASDRINIVVQGPPVPLEPRAALALGMAVHELTTNAVKYGALSIPEGNVSVTWDIELNPDGDQLVLDWVEKNGPRVAPPAHRGFGTTLIERGLRQDMSAQVELEFAVEGVKARLRAPLQTPVVLKADEPAVV